MASRSVLVQLGRQVAKEMASGQMGETARGLAELLGDDPQVVHDLLDLMVKEGRKKKPSSRLIDAYGFMMGQSLETQRFRMEHGFDAATESIARLRTKLVDLVQGGELEPSLGLMIARVFAVAKVDLGTEMRDSMAALMESEAGNMPVMPDQKDMGAFLTELVQEHDGDLFSIQGFLAEMASAFPDEHRAGMAGMLLAGPEPIVREAVVGWLLDPVSRVRRLAASIIGDAAGRGLVSPTMLRRMIVIRNWLPEEDRQVLDDAIRNCRQKGVPCAPAPVAQVREVVASGFDGSGAQSIFVVVKEGRKHAVASLLIKREVGVRDAWVRRGLSKADADDFLWEIEEQVDVYTASTDYVTAALPNFLAVGGASGVLPPFALVDFVETAGLAASNPLPLPAADLVDQLLADVPPARRTPQAVMTALKNSRSWSLSYGFMESWFEEDGAVDAMLSRRRMSETLRITLVLDKVLSGHRARWAETLAWMALLLREDEEEDGDIWIDYALVARELLGDRPLADIGLMLDIAESTVDSWRARNE
ncbi:MAG: hypothetical protein H7840_03955 [Alphaproteobacteria bacterium]